MTAAENNTRHRNNQTPSAADYLPDWVTPRIVVVEKQFHWTGAVQAEVHSRISDEITSPVFQHCETARDALMAAELRSTAAIVLCLPGLEKEILGLLGRLNRTPARQHPILAIGEPPHLGVLPVLMQSGVQTLLTDLQDDLAVSEWCLRILKQRPTRG